jgi:hypothetical protein
MFWLPRVSRGATHAVQMMRSPGSVLIAALLVILSGCAGSRTAHLGDETDTIRVTIIPAEAAERGRALLGQCNGRWTGAFGEMWSPTSADVRRADLLLRHHLSSRLREMGRSLSAEDYVVQFIGTHKDGERVLVANGVHVTLIRSIASAAGVTAFDWRTEVVVPCDVGPRHFAALIDAVGTVREFRFGSPF